MIRKMQRADAATVTEMMRTFYASDAVHTNGSEEIFRADVENCVNDCPYLEGYVFEDGEVQGYAMVAKSFSTEFGKPCIWIEDLYLLPEHRGKGIGRSFFSFIEKAYPGCIFRLEAEPENAPAIHLYKSCGYEELPYMELKKDGI